MFCSKLECHLDLELGKCGDFVLVLQHGVEELVSLLGVLFVRNACREAEEMGLNSDTSAQRSLSPICCFLMKVASKR